MTDFTMPSLGADMESAKVTEWLVKPGSKVKSGDVIVVVETHKGAIEVEVFRDGIISEICVREGETVPVGALLARLTAPGEGAAAAVPAPLTLPPETAPVPPVEEQPVETLVAPAPSREVPRPVAVTTVVQLAPIAGARKKVTPAARRRAADLRVDPEALTGTGIEGSVTLADVEGAPREAPSPGTVEPARKARGGFDPKEMRKAIAAAMGRSKREIPHYYLTSQVDLGAAMAWLEIFNRDRVPAERLLPVVLLLKATALALREVPQLNGFWIDGAFRPGEGIHVGWAISLRGGGLVAPAIHDADRKSLAELMANLRDVVARARSGGLRSSELTDPTVTISSLGDRGADMIIGVIYPPQVAIIGFGHIADRPFVVDGRVRKRPVVSVSLAADHRATDGHIGGLLLAALDRSIQEPERL